ncbi:hypothetical protein [Actinomadura rupiterrae]|uniref:hypothetical protein n=1 Tax=Actinomadura rupiterrae TaxID=559627 RepID=UPI0020A2F428|nr:hypothetical protein [Actinomadura rupiterrae]MCP2336270.1 type II secretory pathway component PulM [Actinomadura rupiterrae]
MGPVERFACELRALRSAAGEAPFGTMARHATVSKSALAAAVAGYQLPSERVLTEFVRLCNGDVRWWLDRLEATRAELSAPDTQAELSTPDAQEEAEKRGWLVPRPSSNIALPPEHALPTTIPGTVLTPPRKRRALLIGALVTVVAFTAGWFVHPISGRSAASPKPTPAAVAPADGVDPYVAGCGRDQKIIERQGMVWPDESTYGWLTLFYSDRCKANWGYVTGPNSSKWRVYIIVHRPADDANVQFSVSADLRPGSWSSILETKPGCVYAEAYVVNSTGRSRSTKTSCYKTIDPVQHTTPTPTPSKTTPKAMAPALNPAS